MTGRAPSTARCCRTTTEGRSTADRIRRPIFVAKDESASPATVYPGSQPRPGTGITIHLAVAAPLEEALERVNANGGEVVSPIVTIPAGRFAYCLDPDGNSFGLFN